MPRVGFLLFAIHCALLFWAVNGFLEMVLPEDFWKPFTNPEFPDWLLVIHWGSVMFASLGFVFGYLLQWTKTPQFMLIGYGMMAVVCAIETFGFMASGTKYVAMAGEYIAYIAILLLLYKAPHFHHYFNQ